MSILLEALRKTEKNQHSHEAPSIHTNDQADPVSESLQTGPLALLLIAALFVSGWFVWQQYQPPAGSYRPPVTLPADKVRKASVPVAADETVNQEVARELDQATPSSPVASNSRGRQRTPVESFQPAASNASQPGTTNAGASTNERPAQQAENASSRPSSSIGTTAAEPVELVQEERLPREPAPIGYWELPDSVRADVPEIKFSVLVYAADPADRFVLINGERLGEGDSSQPGLVVKEIRRDGVIFTYRLYQFLVER